MPRKHNRTMPQPPQSTTSLLVAIVTNLSDATKHLAEAEQQVYEDAQRSVVEARYCGDTTADQIRVL